MKSSSCYNCTSKQYSHYADENGFSLVKCAECGLLFVEQPPDDSSISEALKQGMHSGKRTLKVTGRFNPRKLDYYLKRLDDLFNGDLGGKTTWLDIGCGHGEFMLAVKQYGAGNVVVTGSEPNVKKQKSARSRGLNVSYIDLDSHTQQYDVISLMNVFSHIPDPPAFLNSVKKLLKPGGELILETGDTSDLPAHKYPRPFILPDHLSFASENIMRNLLGKLGFEVLGLHKYPYLMRNSIGFVKEALKLILPQYISAVKYYFMPVPHTDMYIRAKLID